VLEQLGGLPEIDAQLERNSESQSSQQLDEEKLGNSPGVELLPPSGTLRQDRRQKAMTPRPATNCKCAASARQTRRTRKEQTVYDAAQRYSQA